MVKIYSVILGLALMVSGVINDDKVIVEKKEITKEVLLNQNTPKKIWNDQVAEKDLKIRVQELKEMLGYTSQIEVLDLQYREGVLTVNLSDAFISYGGGNEAEYTSIKYILDWGFAYKEVSHITLEIEGETNLFPEGSEIVLCSRSYYQLNYKE